MTRPRTHSLPANPLLTLILIAGGFGTGLAIIAMADSTESDELTATVAAEMESLSIGEPGRITELVAEEGKHAPAGLVVMKYIPLVIESERQALIQERETIERELPALIAQRDEDLKTRQRLLADSLSTIESQIAVIDQKLADQASRDGLVTTELVPGDAASASAFARRAALEDDRKRLTARQQRVEEESASLAESAEELPEIQTLIARVEELQAREESEELQPQRVRTEAGGIVVSVQTRSGERERADSELIRIARLDRRYLNLPVPSRKLDLYPTGGRVRIEFPGGASGYGTVAEHPIETASYPLFANRTANASTSRSGRSAVLRIDPVDSRWPELPIGAEVRVRPDHAE